MEFSVPESVVFSETAWTKGRKGPRDQGLAFRKKSAHDEIGRSTAERNRDVMHYGKPGEGLQIDVAAMGRHGIGKEDNRIQLSGRHKRAKLLIAPSGAALQTPDMQFRAGAGHKRTGAAGADQFVPSKGRPVAQHPCAQVRFPVVMCHQRKPSWGGRMRLSTCGYGEDRTDLIHETCARLKCAGKSSSADCKSVRTGCRNRAYPFLAVDAASHDYRFGHGLRDLSHQRRDIS